jgi:anti-sigma factor RsiW
MTEDADSTPHEEYEAMFSDLHEGSLAEADRKRLLEHLATCEECATAYRELEETMRALAGMKGVPTAPDAFTKGLEDTIHRRSAGAFFGKKTLGDRVPFGILLIVALVVLVAVAAVLWSSQTGTLRYQPTHPSRPPTTTPLPTP